MAFTFSERVSAGFCRVRASPGAAPIQSVFSSNWPMQQALPAIILQNIAPPPWQPCFASPVVNLGAFPFGLLGSSSFRVKRPAFGGRLNSVYLVHSNFRASQLRLSQGVSPLGFWRSSGFAWSFFKPFFQALVQQAPPAIILQPCRLKSAFSKWALFGQIQSRWSSSNSFSQTGPPSARRLTRVSTTEKCNLFKPMFFKRHSISQALFSAGFVVSLGFACGVTLVFQPFWPLCAASASSYCFGSAAPPRWRCAFFTVRARRQIQVIRFGFWL